MRGSNGHSVDSHPHVVGGDGGGECGGQGGGDWGLRGREAGSSPRGETRDAGGVVVTPAACGCQKYAR